MGIPRLWGAGHVISRVGFVFMVSVRDSVSWDDCLGSEVAA